jgi:hypothetical protein
MQEGAVGEDKTDQLRMPQDILLNCGFRAPLSIGTDWWEYDHNRVYVQLEAPFSYEK